MIAYILFMSTHFNALMRSVMYKM